MRQLKSSFKFRPSREVAGLIILLVLVATGVWLGYREKISLSPFVDYSGDGITLIFRTSDHDANGSLLPNNNSDQTNGHYQINPDSPELLQKNAAGDIPRLFRIQGEIEYR